MKYLFFFVHPAKFYLFKETINYLKNNGHTVDILIITKDVLEDLVIKENWDYKNIFPEGRKIKGISPILSSTINLFRTVIRLNKFIKEKNYDLFITDDLLVFLSKLKKVPSIVFTDDDLHVTKNFSIILSRADYILAPIITDLGKYNNKKIGFDSYKEVAYLSPKYFRPNVEIVKEFNPDLKKYFLIRLVSLKSYHDIGKKGLSEKNLDSLINLLKTKGLIFISSERILPSKYDKYVIKLSPEKISHALYFADLFISDSQTMTSEAAVLGTPAFRCNDFVGKISVMEEKEIKYGLTFNYLPKDFDKMLEKIRYILLLDNLKESFKNKRQIMINEKIDLTSFMIWLFENFPNSIIEYHINPSIQYRFK